MKKKLNIAIIGLGNIGSYLYTFLKQADIFISAIGSAKLYDYSFFKEGSTIIDIGISSVDGKTYGDIDNDKINSAITELDSVDILYDKLKKVYKINIDGDNIAKLKETYNKAEIKDMNEMYKLCLVEVSTELKNISNILIYNLFAA